VPAFEATSFMRKFKDLWPLTQTEAGEASATLCVALGAHPEAAEASVAVVAVIPTDEDAAVKNTSDNNMHLNTSPAEEAVDVS
jgi:hypothetical protein